MTTVSMRVLPINAYEILMISEPTSVRLPPSIHTYSRLMKTIGLP